jgi:hypothetical protein
MAETVTLVTPIVRPPTTSIKIERVVLDIVAKSVYIQWLGDDGSAGSASYPTPAPAGSTQPSGATLLNTLNTANLSSNSLVRRILGRLQTDGYIGTGAVTGTPD